MINWILCFSLLLTLPLFGIVSTERLYDIAHSNKLTHHATLYHSALQGNTEQSSLKANYRTGLKQDTYTALLVYSVEKAVSNGSDIQNNGFLHARIVYRYDAPIAVEAFAQNQYNVFTELKQRNLLGGTLRFTIFEPQHSEDDSLVISTGLMLEHEALNSSSATTRLRSSNYILFYRPLSETLILNTVAYIQPLLSDPSNIRVLTESTLDINLTDQLSYNIAFSSSFNNTPAPGVKKLDFALDQGITFSF